MANSDSSSISLSLSISVSVSASASRSFSPSWFASLVDVLVGVERLVGLGVDVHVDVVGSAVAARGVGVATVAGDAAEAEAVAAVGVAEVDDLLALEVDVAGVAADARAVRAATVATDGDAAVAAGAGRGVGVRDGVLLEVALLVVGQVGELGVLVLVGGGLVLDDVVVEVEAVVDLGHEAVEVERLAHGVTP